MGYSPHFGKAAQSARAFPVSTLCRSEGIWMRTCNSICAERHDPTIAIHGSRVAIGPQDSISASIQIETGRISRLIHDSSYESNANASSRIDLTGFLVLPGLINAHDIWSLRFSPSWPIRPIVI